MSTSKPRSLTDELQELANQIRQNACEVDRIITSTHPEIMGTRDILALRHLSLMQAQLVDSMADYIVIVAEVLRRDRNA